MGAAGRIYASVNRVSIGSENGESPSRCQAIILTNAGILLNGPLGANFSVMLIKNLYILIHENAFENVVWKIAAILSRPQCVKDTHEKCDEGHDGANRSDGLQ